MFQFTIKDVSQSQEYYGYTWVSGHASDGRELLYISFMVLDTVSDDDILAAARDKFTRDLATKSLRDRWAAMPGRVLSV